MKSHFTAISVFIFLTILIRIAQGAIPLGSSSKMSIQRSSHQVKETRLLVEPIVVPSSPEPPTDPFAIPKPDLFLVTAGHSSAIIKPLTTRGNNAICLKDYPDGISVLCTGPGKLASFRVNREMDMVVRSTPFYIAGGLGRVVRPWHAPPHIARVMCSIDERYRVIAKVEFRC